MARPEKPAAPKPEAIVAMPAYQVSDDVEVSHCDRDGSELRFRFSAGDVQPASEDEWFVLEHVLVPQGHALRVKKEK